MRPVLIMFVRSIHALHHFFYGKMQIRRSATQENVVIKLACYYWTTKGNLNKFDPFILKLETSSLIYLKPQVQIRRLIVNGLFFV